MRQFLTANTTETQKLGKSIGERLHPGSIIALMGELGCGKTCFTKGLCAGLGIAKREVNSPSFTLANEYNGKFPVYHLDLYRIEDIETSIDMGLTDYLLRSDSGILIVEWAERILPLLSDNYLEVSFSVISPRKRLIVLTAHGERFNKLLDEMDNDNSGY